MKKILLAFGVVVLLLQFVHANDQSFVFETQDENQLEIGVALNNDLHSDNLAVGDLEDTELKTKLLATCEIDPVRLEYLSSTSIIISSAKNEFLFHCADLSPPTFTFHL